METTVFVYKKKAEIKVLSFDAASDIEKHLLTDGWDHTHTLEAAIYLQYLLNLHDDTDILNEVKSLQ